MSDIFRIAIDPNYISQRLTLPLCPSCGYPIGKHQTSLTEKVDSGMTLGDALDSEGLTRLCCRGHMMTPAVYTSTRDYQPHIQRVETEMRRLRRPAPGDTQARETYNRNRDRITGVFYMTPPGNITTERIAEVHYLSTGATVTYRDTSSRGK